MIQTNKKKILHTKSILSSIFIVILSILFVQVQASWDSPTQLPPYGNTPVLLNTSSLSQVKSGGLGLGSLLVTGGSIFDHGIFSLKEQASSPIAEANYGKLYWKTDNVLYQLNSQGVEKPIGGIGGKFIDGTASGQVVYTDGNVGIGTTNPTEKLQVDGDILLSSPTSGIYSVSLERTDEASKKHKWAMIHMNDAYGRNNLGLYEYHDSDGSGAYECGSNECKSRLVIKAGGNLGIGTTNPEEKLQVNGRISIQSASPTVILRDTDNRSAMIHANSNRLYFLRGSGTNSSTYSTYNSMWPLYFDLENNQGIFGGSLGIRTTPTGNLANHKAIAFGDGDTGIRQNGDGRLEFYANNVNVIDVVSTGISLNNRWIKNGYWYRSDSDREDWHDDDGWCKDGYYLHEVKEDGDDVDYTRCGRP